MFADRIRWNLEENRLSQAVARSRATGRAFVDLTVSNPTRCGFSYASKAILAALSNPGALDYDPQPFGMLAARQAVVEYYAAHGVNMPAASVLLTTGTSEAYSHAFRLLCNAADEALISTPGYPLLDYLADINDVRLVRYPLFYDHGWQINLQQLQRRITAKTRAIIVVHSGNPTGQFVSPAEREELAALCVRHDLVLVADEVFLDFPIDAAQPQTFANQADALTFTLGGLSKMCGLPQVKFAWIAVTGPDSLKQDALARLEVIADSYLSMNAAVQLAAPALMQQRFSFGEQVRARIHDNLAELDRQLAASTQCTRLEAQGGWSVILRAPVLADGEETAVRLLETHGVLVQPGHFYDLPGDACFVVSLLTQTGEFAEGIRRFLSAF
jgi:aspartate/methionine/tyrosine aminotransferase